MLVLDIWWFDTESSTGKISTSNILHANICSKNRIINISINEMQQKIVPPSKFVDLKTSFLTWQCDAEQVGVPVWKYSPFSICGISMVSNWCILKEPTLINIRVEYDLCLKCKKTEIKIVIFRDTLFMTKFRLKTIRHSANSYGLILRCE